MPKIKWNRPSGIPIETNDLKVTIAHLEKLGWTRIEAETNNGDPVVEDPVTTIDSPVANPDQMDNDAPAAVGGDSTFGGGGAGGEGVSHIDVTSTPSVSTPAKRGRGRPRKGA